MKPERYSNPDEIPEELVEWLETVFWELAKPWMEKIAYGAGIGLLTGYMLLVASYPLWRRR